MPATPPVKLKKMEEKENTPPPQSMGMKLPSVEPSMAPPIVAVRKLMGTIVPQIRAAVDSVGKF